MRVVTKAQMRQIEENSLRHDLTFQRLMENAGSAAAAFLRRAFKIRDRNCIIFCAKGNNGGDGLVVARKLTEHDVNVVVTLLGGRPVSPEAAEMYRLLDEMGVPILDFEQASDKLASWLTQTDLVVDALCGTGFAGALRDDYREACELINHSACAVVSLDIPTGVECDSGRIAQGAVQADFTLVFDSLKPAHVLPVSKGQCGAVEVLDIGIPPEAREGLVYGNYGEEQPPACAVREHSSPDSQAREMPRRTPAEPGKLTLSGAFERIPPRREDAHKGSFGKLVNVAGSSRYRGAAILSTLGALRCGVGTVTLCSTEPVCAAASVRAPEAIFLPLAHNDIGTLDGTLPLSALTECLETADAAVFGCGLGNNLHTARLLEHVLKNSSCPLVLDADGINAVAGNIHVLKEARAPLLLTPHPGEMARLIGCDIPGVEADREGTALGFARRHNVTVVLKGPRTLIACPDGELTVNETGNSGLAKGGSGDLLAGIIGALLAQGMAPRHAASVGVFLHGMAADRAAARLSRTAMLPGDLLEELAAIFLEQGR